MTHNTPLCVALVVVLTLVVSVAAQLDLTWKACAPTSTDVSQCTVKYNIPKDITTECGTAPIIYMPTNPNSINITYSVKRFVGTESTASVIYFGDLIVCLSCNKF
jgi:hypothetical protein